MNFLKISCFSLILLSTLFMGRNVIANDVPKFIIAHIAESPNILLDVDSQYHAKAAKYVEQLRSKHGYEKVLFFHGGDSLAPSAISMFDHGRNIINLANSLKVDFYSISQREMTFGVDELSLRATESAFPVVSANLLDKRDMQPVENILPYKIFTIDGMKIGVTSLVSYNVKNNFLVQHVDLSPLETVLQNIKQSFAQQSVDVAILLTDLKGKNLQHVIDQKYFGLVIETKNTENTITQQDATWFTQSGGNDNEILTAAYLGDNSWKIDTVNLANQAPSQTVDALVNQYYHDVLELNDSPIAVAMDDFSSERMRVRSTESAFLNHFVDALRINTRSDIALLNSGAVRSYKKYPKGYQFTRHDIQSELPYGNRYSVVELTGQEIKIMLENGVSKVDEQDGRFLHVSGINYRYNPQKPVGQRIVSVTHHNSPINPTQKFKVVVSNFIMAGGNDYTLLKNKEAINSTFTDRRIWHVVADYFMKMKEVYAENLGRIEVVTDDDR